MVPESAVGTKLSVHHVDYDKYNSDPSNLVALCDTCHPMTNWNREYWQTVLTYHWRPEHVEAMRAAGLLPNVGAV